MAVQQPEDIAAVARESCWRRAPSQHNGRYSTMLHINGYHLTEQIAENTHCLVYRVYSDWDNQPVILKLPVDAVPSPEQHARFQHEYDLLRSLDAAGVIRCYRLGQAGQRPMLVLE